MLAATSSRQLVTAVANGLPDDALAHIRTPNGKRAVVLLKGNTMALWDFEGHRQYAKLDEHVRIREVGVRLDGCLSSPEVTFEFAGIGPAVMASDTRRNDLRIEPIPFGTSNGTLTWAS
jgi:hypothetical protein